MKNTHAQPDPRFQQVLEQMDDDDQELYRELRFAKCTPTRVGEVFVLFEYSNGKPVELDRLRITNFTADPQRGVRIVMVSEIYGETVEIGFEPKRLFDYDVFVHSPLSPHLSWQFASDTSDKGFMVFPLVIKTRHKPSFQKRPGEYFDTKVVFDYEVFSANHQG